MDPTKSASNNLLAEISRQRRTLPIFLAPRLAPLLDLVETWVQSVEARLCAIDKMPSIESLKILNTPAAQLSPAVAAAMARADCKGCDE